MRRVVSLAAFVVLLLSACSEAPVPAPVDPYVTGYHDGYSDGAAAVQCPEVQAPVQPQKKVAKKKKPSIVITIPLPKLPSDQSASAPRVKEEWQVCLDKGGDWKNKRCVLPGELQAP